MAEFDPTEILEDVRADNAHIVNWLERGQDRRVHTKDIKLGPLLVGESHKQIPRHDDLDRLLGAAATAGYEQALRDNGIQEGEQ